MNTSIKPLDRPAGLADRVYHQLRDSIGNHQIKPGERLQEVNLAAQLAVSRTPVREALARLESEGMIVVEGRGFVVPELTDTDIEEIYQLRFLLEPAAAASAVAETTSAADLASMASEIEDATAADNKGDFRAFLEANGRFHNAWRALVPNRRMSKLLDQYVGHVRFLRVLTLGDANARKAALTGMKNIHEAFKSRDKNAAVEAMVKHLEAAKHFLIVAIEQINKEKDIEHLAAKQSNTETPPNTGGSERVKANSPSSRATEKSK